MLHHNIIDVVSRVHRASASTLPVVALLAARPFITHVRNLSTVPTAALYRRHQRAGGGRQGRVLSVVFRNPRCAEVFYDALDVYKGTSFGTNFTLCVPFVVLAHYHEMDWIESCRGVAKHILRLSVGLEDQAEIVAVVEGR